MAIYQSKYWVDGNSERLDYADLDSAGQVLAAFEPGGVTTAKLATNAVETKIGQQGGAGIVGAFILPVDRTTPNTALSTFRLASLSVAGVTAGDGVVVGDLILPDGTTPSVKNKVYFGVADTNKVDLYAYQLTSGGDVLPEGSRLNFRVYTFA